MRFLASLRMMFGSATASFLLRFGVGIPFLLFGYGKFVDPLAWLSFIPPWLTVPLLSLTDFLKVIGSVELMLGVLLVLGIWVRIAAAIAALHLFGVLVAVGWNDLAVRDFSMLLAAIALVALGPAGCRYALSGRWWHRTR